MVLFELTKLRNPNHAKLRLMLTILNRNLGAYLELPKHGTQPDAGLGDVQRVGQIAIGDA